MSFRLLSMAISDHPSLLESCQPFAVNPGEAAEYVLVVLPRRAADPLDPARGVHPDEARRSDQDLAEVETVDDLDMAAVLVVRELAHLAEERPAARHHFHSLPRGLR